MKPPSKQLSNSVSLCSTSSFFTGKIMCHDKSLNDNLLSNNSLTSNQLTQL